MKNIFKTLFNQIVDNRALSSKAPLIVSEPETRTAIKSQTAPTDLPYNEAEQDIIDRFERLPRPCKRYIGRQNPTSWHNLSLYIDYHEERLITNPRCNHK